MKAVISSAVQMLYIKGEHHPTSCSETNEQIHLCKRWQLDIFEVNIGSVMWTVTASIAKHNALVRGPNKKEVAHLKGDI